MRSGLSVRSRVGACFALSFLLLSGCGAPKDVTATGTPSVPAHIPWIASAGASMASSPLPAQRTCGAVDLKLVAGQTGAWQGRASQQILLTQVGPEPCYLPAPPDAAALLPDGAVDPATPNRSAVHRVDLRPSQGAFLLVGTPASCAGVGHPKVADRLRLTLPGSQVVTVDGVWINVECGPPEVLIFSADPAPTPTGPLAGLRVRMDAPGTVQRGTTLTYLVTLANPTQNTIVLDPCPSYTEALGTAADVGPLRTLLLNCSAAPSLAPGAQLVYEMKLAVPSTMPLGPTKLSWQLDVPAGATAGARLSVT